jgi:hypothetical protein
MRKSGRPDLRARSESIDDKDAKATSIVVAGQGRKASDHARYLRAARATNRTFAMTGKYNVAMKQLSVLLGQYLFEIRLAAKGCRVAMPGQPSRIDD